MQIPEINEIVTLIAAVIGLITIAAGAIFRLGRMQRDIESTKERHEERFEEHEEDAEIREARLREEFLAAEKRVRDEIEAAFRRQGERLGTLEASCFSHGKSIDELERRDQTHEFKILDLTGKDGELTGKLDRIKETLNRHAELKTRGEVEVADRLARIEERLDVFIKLHVPKGGRNG